MSTSLSGAIAIMGSGEMTKSMLPVHRTLVDRAKRCGALSALFLDTPAAFQNNVDDLAKQAAIYYQESLQVHLDTPAWREHCDPARRPAYLRTLEQANLIFSGPGSPSYALRQWAGTRVPQLLTGTLAKGGSLIFSSAAALTMGRSTIPVYEIFKSGEEPRWLEGLDLLSRLGLEVAVVPHYNNGAGKGFDTRFCYLGEDRFRQLKATLPASTAILGIDENTACVIDCTEQIVSAMGKGTVSFELGGEVISLRSGQSVPLSDWVDPQHIAAPPTPTPTSTAPPAKSPDSAHEVIFAALGSSRSHEAEQAVLNMCDQITELKRVQANHLLLVDRLMELRRQARNSSDWALADLIRAALEGAGVTLSDTGTGTVRHMD